LDDIVIYYLNRKNRAACTRAFIDFFVEHFRRSEGASNTECRRK
jgi:hypothetical protein